MARPLLSSIIGLLIVSLDWTLFHLYHLAQASWKESFRQSGKLAYWWVFTGLLFMVGYLGIAAIVWLLVRKYLNARFTRLGASVAIDLAMATALWSMGILFQDPLLATFLSDSGLLYLPTVLFVAGLLWIFVGAMRVKLLLPYCRNPIGGSSMQSEPSPTFPR